MKTWNTQTIADLGKVVTGKTPPSSNPEQFGDKYPFITPSDIEWGAKSVATERALSEKGKDAHQRILLPRKSVCVVCIASIGKVCFTSEDSVTNQQINSIIVDAKNHDPDFVFYLASLLRSTLEAYAGGTATPIVNKGSFSKIKVQVPERSIQRKIAAILTAYDGLIETNKRRIALLEKMVEELYREWFARMRFPGHQNTKFVKGVPEGWEIKRLGEILELAYGKALKESDREPGEFHVYGSGGIVGSHSKALVKNKGIIVGRKGNVGAVHLSDRGFFPIDTVFYVVSELPLTFLFFLLRTMNFINNDAAVPGLNRNQAYSNQLFYPGSDLITKFAEMADPIFDAKHQIQAQNENLTQTRDLLLPRLISGKLSVEDLDIQFPPSMQEEAIEPEPAHA
jgi:type I restriction enzyme, S subunit